MTTSELIKILQYADPSGDMVIVRSAENMFCLDHIESVREEVVEYCLFENNKSLGFEVGQKVLII